MKKNIYNDDYDDGGDAHVLYVWVSGIYLKNNVMSFGNAHSLVLWKSTLLVLIISFWIFFRFILTFCLSIKTNKFDCLILFRALSNFWIYFNLLLLILKYYLFRKNSLDNFQPFRFFLKFKQCSKNKILIRAR